MEERATDHIEKLIGLAGEYLETNIDLYKLKAVDKLSDILSAFISKLIILLMFVLFLFILNIGLALYLGALLGKSYYGFFLLAAIYLIIGVIFNSNRNKWFKEPLANIFIRNFLK